MPHSSPNPQPSTRNLVTIFGGSGFVGRHIAAAMHAAGWRVRIASRNASRAKHLSSIGEGVEFVNCNIMSASSVTQAVQGSKAIVNCVGILGKSGAQNFDGIHVDGSAHIAAAAQKNNITQFVHISAIGADAQGISSYAKTKGLGEQGILKTVPTAVILRPSIVVGPEDSFFNRFAAMAQLSPFLPAIGGGTTKFQPVFVDDLADAVVAALSGKATNGIIYECGGPEIFTFKELMQRVATYTGRNTIPLSLPIWFAKLLAIGTKPFPLSIRPITYDQVLLLKNDNVVSAAAINDKRTLQGLGIAHPKRIDEVVPHYLAKFRRRG